MTAVLDESPQSMSEVVVLIRDLDRGRTLQDVIDDLYAIEDAKDGYTKRARRGLRRRRRPDDGVACFNYMYLRVSETVRDQLGGFAQPAVLERIAVVFAEYYLQAYRAAADRQWISRAWEPIFARREDKGVSPLQFALAGMNAHINNDVALALLQVWDEFGVAPADASPEHADFIAVNKILAHVQAEVRDTLQSPIMRWLDRLFRKLDDRLATISISRAREEAWDRATLWRAGVNPKALVEQDRAVGYQSHLILAF